MFLSANETIFLKKVMENGVTWQDSELNLGNISQDRWHTWFIKYILHIL